MRLPWVPISDANTLNVLSECYDYFNKNRHQIFHTKQMGATKILSTPNEAEKIIYEVLKLFEDSYNILNY